MFKCCCLSVIFSFLLCTNILANTFLVTTNADSGTGSLRDAITIAAANGTSVNDTILFTIVDISRDGRTIILLTALPKLSSNLIIDGTSQLGLPIGKSNAKIILLRNIAEPGQFDFFKIEYADNVQLYGLFLFNDQLTIFNADRSDLIGVNFKWSTNIVIGKAGKGNYFRGLTAALYSRGDLEDKDSISKNISIQANIFNNDEDGSFSIIYNSKMINPMDYAIQFFNVSNITIGGAKIEDGNTFSVRNIWITSSHSVGNGAIFFSNNYCNLNTDGIAGNVDEAGFITIIVNEFYRQDYLIKDFKITLKNNAINGQVSINGTNEFITIQGNKIFSNQSQAPTNYAAKIIIDACSGGGIIGGETAELSNNIFTLTQRADYAPLYKSDHLLGAISIYGSPKISIIKNSTHCTNSYESTIKVKNSDEPTIQIDSTAINFVKGKATPNTIVEVFLDDDCKACDGILFLGRTTARADSSWNFSGIFSSAVIATATRANGSTSRYTEPTALLDRVKIIHPTCGLKNGSCKGIYGLVSSDNVEWHQYRNDINNNQLIDTIISTKPDAENLGAGLYYFVAKLGKNCLSAPYIITLVDHTPKIDGSNAIVLQPTCGKFNGSISNVDVFDYDSATFKCINDAGTEFLAYSYNFMYKNYIRANNLAPGNYRLIVTDTKKSCADSSKFFIITNQSGPALNLNNVVITNTVCSNSKGNIKGIVASNATGTAFIGWQDAIGNTVGNQLDLTNVVAGKYKLLYKDQGGCDTIKTIFYEIKDNGVITINTTMMKIVPAGCTVNNGSISNLTATNASRFTWVNVANSSIAGTALDLIKVAAGNYQLTATNAFGCSANSLIINIPTGVFAGINVASVTFANASCGLNNGQINVTSFTSAPGSYIFNWLDSATNKLMGSGNKISGLSEGTYLLMATDTNGCVKQIYSKNLAADPKPVISTASAVITADACSANKGSILSVMVQNAGSSINYNWINKNNTVISNAANLINVGAGLYQLKINNANGCKVESGWLQVKNNDEGAVAPIFNNVTIAKNAIAILKVKNYTVGNYFLYADAAGTQLLLQNTTGNFTTGTITENTNYYIGYSTGTCKSSITMVAITVVDKSYFTIPKAFTPNNDNQNDLLHIRVFGYISLNYFQLFDRYGKLIFATQNINDTWDGTFKGMPLTTGGYVWIAEGKDITGKIISDKGTVMLLR